jgi:REP element-mobilizing transposase RayT
VPHLPRARVSRHNGVHVTLRLVDGLPSLRRPTLTDLLLRLFGAECRRKGFRLVHFAIRSNHLHLVCEADAAQALSRGVQRLASRAARGLNARLRRSGRVFRDRFHAVVVSSPRQMRNVLRYVMLNAHKDAARSRRVLDGVDLWSSAFYFDGFANVGAVPSEPPPKPGERIARAQAPPVTEPRSWLLRTGWRRYGLIDTTEYAPLAAPAEAPASPWVPRASSRCSAASA